MRKHIRKTTTISHSLFYEPALACGLDLTKEMGEVAPAAHTCLGGIRINPDCSTDVPGLFSAGEAAGGIHGANRIGGTAGTETLVFGKIAGISAGLFAARQQTGEELQTLDDQETAEPDNLYLKDISDRLSALYSSYFGILKSENELRKLEQGIYELKEILSKTSGRGSIFTPSFTETRNALTVAETQVKAALLRKESRGVFYRTDKPESDSRYDYMNTTAEYWNGNITVKLVHQ